MLTTSEPLQPLSAAHSDTAAESYFRSDEIAALWAACDFGRAGPTLIKRPFSKPIVADEDLLQILKTWSAAVRRGRTPAPTLEYIDRHGLIEAQDTTLDAWIDRLEHTWHDDWFAYVNDLHQYDGELWARAVEILMPAIRRSGGLPAGGFRIEGFFGKYEATPTGIHLDSSDNFSFIVRGPKRLVFWPNDRFQPLVKRPDARAPSQQMALTGDYQTHMDGAIVIDAHAGDVVYWSKEYWHVGASPEAWTGMVNLAMWWNASPLTLAQFVLQRVVDLEGEPRLHPFDPEHMPADATTLPETLRNAVQGAIAQVATRAEPVAELVWASVATSYGFTTPPGEASVPPLTDETTLRVRHAVVPLLTGNGAFVAACGRVLPAHVPDPVGACGQLNARTASVYRVRELYELFGAGTGNEGNRVNCTQLIAKLIACRAFELIRQ